MDYKSYAIMQMYNGNALLLLQLCAASVLYGSMGMLIYTGIKKVAACIKQLHPKNRS